MIFTINAENNISAFATAKDIENPEATQQFKSAKELGKTRHRLADRTAD